MYKTLGKVITDLGIRRQTVWRRALVVGLVGAVQILIATGSSLAAQDFSVCIKIDNDLDRLACYDRRSGRTPKSVMKSAKSDWKLRTETSKLDDSTNIFLAVKSNESVDCGWNRGGEITLRVRCMDNTTALILNTGCHMTSHSGYGTVEYRIDDGKAGKVRMDESTDNRALGLWRGGSSIPLIKKLIGKQTLLVDGI